MGQTLYKTTIEGQDSHIMINKLQKHTIHLYATFKNVYIVNISLNICVYSFK